MKEKKKVLSLSVDEFKLLLNIIGSEEIRRLGVNMTERKLILGHDDFLWLLKRMTDERQRKIDTGGNWNQEAVFIMRLIGAKEKRVKER